MESVYVQMAAIRKKDIASRLRFMIMDVCELREVRLTFNLKEGNRQLLATILIFFIFFFYIIINVLWIRQDSGDREIGLSVSA